MLYDDIIRDLIRRGLDQCQSALRRLSNKRLYRQHKAALTDEQQKQCRGRGKMEAREFRLDSLGQASEAIITKLRNLSNAMDGERGEPLDHDHASSDGWADPFDGETELQATRESPTEGFASGSDLASFDPHVHARRKPKENSRQAVVERKKKKQKRVRETAPLSTRTRVPANHDGPRPEVSKRQRRRKDERSSKEREENEQTAGSDTDRNEMSDSDADMGFASNDELPTGFSDDETPEGTGKESRTRRHQSTLNTVFLAAGTRLPRESAAASRQQDRAPIADRMQQFLDANAGGGLDISTPDSHDKNREKVRRRERHARKASAGSDTERDGSQQHGNIASRAASREPQKNSSVNREDLFSLLGDRREQPREVRQAAAPLENTIPEMCQSLLERYHNSSCTRLLDGIVARAEASALEAFEHDSLVFTTLLDLLRLHGREIIQDLVAGESVKLEAHVSLLSTLLRLLRLGVNKDLSPDDGVASEIFSLAHFTKYIDFVVLQTVEAVFSLVHPSAWSLQVKNPRRILRILEPLRDAIAENVHLVERACRCLDQELEPQKWRCVSTAQRVFVSSVNPETWQTFLDSGVLARRLDTPRSAAFGKELPRCEVDAMWSFLAYFSCSTQPALEDKGVYRWQLISKLFTRGVLTASPSESLPPCESQLEVCAVELNNLTSLLLSSSLDNLPGRDSILANLIQRSLFLEADALFHNEDSRLSAYPSSTDEKADRRLAAKLWNRICNDTNSPTPVRQETFDIGRALTKGGEYTSFMGKPIVLPSSRLTLSCIALVSAWTRQVPLKKARRSRLANALNSLTKSLLEECTRLDAEPIVGDSSLVEADSFEAAFSSTPFSSSTPVKSGLGAKRKALFLREAVAYLTVVSMVTSATPDAGDRTLSASLICQRVWDIMADDAMKCRREEILKNERSRSVDSSVDDSYRLYLTAKMMSFVALLVLGIAPWNNVLPETVSTTLDFFRGEGGGEDAALEFLFSCLVACLDCAADSRHGIEITACIGTCIGMVLTNTRNQRSTNLTGPLQLSIDRLSMLPGMLIPTLEKVFRLLITASFCGLEEDLCMMSLLSTLRGSLHWSTKVDIESMTAAIVPQHGSRIEIAKSNDDSPTDDFWGDIDDALLARIDLEGDGMASRNSSDASSIEAVCKLFVESLDQAKPSTRFDVVQSIGDTSDTSVAISTASGRKLIGSRSGPLCRCLAALVASDESHSTAMLLSKLWLAPTKIDPGEDRRDMEFRKGLAQTVASELCLLALSDPRSRQLVQCNQQGIFSSLLETMLDPKVLRKYPSCNLVRLKANGGSSSEQKVLARLMKFNNGTPAPAMVAREAWKFCTSFGRALIEQSEARGSTLSELGRFLLKPDLDLSPTPSRQMMVSMEREYLDRFKMFRGIVSQVAETSPTPFDIEKVASVVLGSTEYLVGLLKRLRLYKADQDAEAFKGYEHAKSIEDLSSFVEFHASVLAWVYRERRHAISESSLAWIHLCDDYLSPLLQGKNFNVFGVLDRVVSIAVGVPDGISLRANAIATEQAEAVPCVDMLTEAIIRRSREFMLYIAHEFSAGSTWRSSNFFRAILAAGTSQDSHVAWTISRSFCSEAYSLPPAETMLARSPLQTSIDEYITRVEKCHPLSDQDFQSLLSLKRHAIRNVLIPRLSHERSDLSTKSGIVRLLRFMLDAEHDEAVPVGVDTRMDALVLCSLAKALCLSLRAALYGSSVDDELVAVIFSCATSLVNLPATCIDPEAVGWLIHWCCSNGSNDTDMHATVKRNHASYLWSFSCLLMSLGQLICQPSGDAAPVTIHSFREELRSMQASGEKACWPKSAEKESSSVSAERMQRYEELLFPKRENDQTITNVYASKRIACDMDAPLERWLPSLNARRSVQRFVAEVNPVCTSLSTSDDTL